MKLFRAPLAACVGLLVLAGCDFPTEAPNLEQRWILPVETTTLSVDELLPSSVMASGGNWTLSVDDFTTTQSLGTACGSCGASNGQTIPKPGFTHQFTLDQTLPTDVSNATLSGGSIDISVRNNFSFDPIAGGGSVTITLRDGPGGPQLGQVVIDGATESLGAGATVTKAMTLATATIGGTFTAEVDIDSPASATLVTINTSQTLVVTATPNNVMISSATVDVDGQTVDFEPSDLDVEDMDEAMTDRIQQGAVILDIANPFGVSVSGTVNIGTTSKTLSVPSSATSQVTLSYSGDELRQFLGKPGVQFYGSGTISAVGPITVSPGQEVTLKASIDLTILIG